MIHITHRETDVILDDISEDSFWLDKHKKSLKDTLETFDFTTFADKKFSEHLTNKNRIVINDDDGELIEFIITHTIKYRSAGVLKCEVFTSASYLTLKNAKIIKPHTTDFLSAESHARLALSGTDVEVGDIAFKGVKTLIFEDYTNPYKYLKKIANEFDLELHFRVKSDGTKIIKRYVDLVERVGIWQGREVELGKDLSSIERKEDFSNVVTALFGLGPIREDGSRLEVTVENVEALQRWGRNGQHIIETYETQSTDIDMTESRLRELTEIELKKRINSVVQYRADIIDLESVIGLEHEKIRFGDTIKIKDTKFKPPLFLEARVHTQERSIKKKGEKSVELGDFIEYSEDQVNAAWKQLQKHISFKIGQSELADYTYEKSQIDGKDTAIYTNSTSYAYTQSQTAQSNAERYAYDNYEPIKTTVNTNKNTWDKASIFNADGTLNVDLLSGQLTDDQIKSAGTWNGMGTYIDGNGVYTGLIVANQIVSDSLSAISADLGTINAGTINGVNINGSAFKQTGTNGTITIDNQGFVFKGTNSSIEMDIVQTSGYHGDIASLVFKDNRGLRAMEIYQHYTDSVIESDRGLLFKASDLGIYLDGTAMHNAFNVPGVEIGGGLKVTSTTMPPLKLQNNNGFVSIGNENSVYAHIKTSAAKFYFDKLIDVVDEVRIYGTGKSYMKGDTIYSANGVFGNVRGVMRHDSGYFTIFPYNASYDDGSYARFFYAGSGNSSFASRTIHFSSSSGGLKLSAAGFNQSSLLEKKTNIVPFDKSVLDDYRHNLDLYTFDYVDNGIGLQNNIGFVIGDGYKAPKEIMDVEEKSASLYNFISYNAKAIKEVVSIYDDHEMCINTLADRINYLEMENQVLKQRLNRLEGAA